jgi:hypothetical protein
VGLELESLKDVKGTEEASARADPRHADAFCRGEREARLDHTVVF